MHKENFISTLNLSTENSGMDYYSTVRIVVGVENQGSKLIFIISTWTWNILDNGLIELVYTFTGLCRYPLQPYQDPDQGHGLSDGDRNQYLQMEDQSY